jgi:hypothetical protein
MGCACPSRIHPTGDDDTPQPTSSSSSQTTTTIPTKRQQQKQQREDTPRPETICMHCGVMTAIANTVYCARCTPTSPMAGRLLRIHPHLPLRPQQLKHEVTLLVFQHHCVTEHNNANICSPPPPLVVADRSISVSSSS